MKKWYLSKTLWANLLAIVAVFGLELTGEEVTAVLAVINLVLRVVTKEELTW
ncbi:MAG: hypothetical protein DDT36_01522 [Firmicutes bacterium]|nr:hypothetical protein [Bacillota bacterium]